jgi:hypothetical protein
MTGQITTSTAGLIVPFGDRDITLPDTEVYFFPTLAQLLEVIRDHKLKAPRISDEQVEAYMYQGVCGFCVPTRDAALLWVTPRLAIQSPFTVLYVLTHELQHMARRGWGQCRTPGLRGEERRCEEAAVVAVLASHHLSQYVARVNVVAA